MTHSGFGQTDIVIRPATPAESHLAVRFTRLLVEEMAQQGGYPAKTREEDWKKFEEIVRGGIESPDQIHVIVFKESNPEPIGFGHASIAESHIAVESPKILHVGAVYVSQESRRRGIGRRITEELLAWGRQQGCREASLNVLTKNPARYLYESMGFGEFEMKMRRPIEESK